MTGSHLNFRKKEHSGRHVKSRLHRIKGGNKKYSSETIVVNQVRDDGTQMSVEAIEINYMGRFRICFGSSADRDCI